MVNRAPAYPAANLERVLTVWAIGLGTAAVALMMIFSCRDYLPFPILDEWNIITTLDLNHGRFPLDQLWAQHNEHRIPFARLLFLADLFWFHGNNLVPFFAIYFMQVTQFCLIVWAVYRWSGWPLWMVLVAAGLAAFTLFWLSQWESFLNPFEVSYIGAFFGCTAAVLCLLFASSEKRTAGRWLCFVACAAFLAEANLANGLMVWPLLIAMAVRVRIARSNVILLAIAAAAFLAIYLYGYVSPAYHANPVESLTRPLLVIRYLLHYLTIGWAGKGETCGLLLASAALVVTPACYVWEIVRPTTHPFRLAIASLSLLMLGTGLVTALGRINFPLAQASASRYQTPALLFWLFFSIYLLDVAFRFRAVYAVWVSAGTLIAATAMLASFTVARNDADRFAEGVRAAVLPVQAGVTDQVIREAIHPDPNVVFAYTRFLKDHDDGFFRDTAYQLLGSPVSHFVLRPPDRCSGQIESARKIPDSNYPGWEIRGWARDKQSGVLEHLLAVTDGKTISGLGVSQGFTWRLYLRGAQDYAALQIYGVVDGGKAICEVQSAVSLPALKPVDRLATIGR